MALKAALQDVVEHSLIAFLWVQNRTCICRRTTLNCGNYAFNLVIRTHFIILHFLSPTATADGVNSAEYDGEEGQGCATAFFTGCRPITDYNIST